MNDKKIFNIILIILALFGIIYVILYKGNNPTYKIYVYLVFITIMVWYYINNIYEKLDGDIDIVSNKKTVYIITNISSGGAVKYLNDIISNYSNNNYIYIKSRKQLNSIQVNDNDILFIQHILHTNISIYDIIDKINENKNKCKIYLSIHDFHWIFGNNIQMNDVMTGYLLSDTEIINSPNYNNINKLFELCDIIIHPSKFTYNIFSKYFYNINYQIQYHNDYYFNNDSIYLPLIKNNEINIGNLSGFSECKGSDYILDLIDKYKTYNNYTINFIVVGYNSPAYNETEYYEYVKKYNIHGLTYLNKWGETWCYSLTKALNTGLPIVYNNIGAFKERIPDKEQYFIALESEYDDIQKIYESFEKMLDYIIDNNGKYDKFYNNKEIIYNPFYDSIFE
jgi:hypothetical protein